MDQGTGWRNMATAPRDGSRILVTVRPVEQGPADVDIAYWAPADRDGMEGWRAADSHPGQVFAYAEPELKCWMPLPESGDAPRPDAWQGDEAPEVDGSGI